jgi:hypothetical protein
MMTEAEVYPSLLKLIGYPVRTSATILALEEVVQKEPALDPYAGLLRIRGRL